MTISGLLTSILTVLSTPAGMIGIAVTGVSILGYITYSMFVNTTDTTQDMATSQPAQKESFNANQSAEQEVETKEASRGFLFSISSFAYEWTAGWFFTDSTTDKQLLAQLKKAHQMLENANRTLGEKNAALEQENSTLEQRVTEVQEKLATTCQEIKSLKKGHDELAPQLEALAEVLKKTEPLFNCLGESFTLEDRIILNPALYQSVINTALKFSFFLLLNVLFANATDLAALILTVLSTPVGMIGIAVTGVSILGYITYSMFANTTDTTEASRGFLFSISSFAYDWTAGWFFTGSTTDKQSLAQLQKEHQMPEDANKTLRETNSALTEQNNILETQKSKFKNTLLQSHNKLKGALLQLETLKEENAELAQRKASLFGLLRKTKPLFQSLEELLSKIKPLFQSLEEMPRLEETKIDAATYQVLMDILSMWRQALPLFNADLAALKGDQQAQSTVQPVTQTDEPAIQAANQRDDPVSESDASQLTGVNSTPVLFSPNQAEEVPTHLNSDPKQESEAIQNKPGSGNN